ncbi:hypothetical protein GQ43DRAFT_41412 [Delitschia confertaspora ATCC 74209]|uniref:RSE1/DDB1/CPSF1 first beta-propeller domain-containing protein n=1 Tax=Delitschia confertaspora ATCC 74209 TaxID=1513339 RepID=A0A9P4MYW1_9PLEO|nr:hypothetical protein GQ43DRAFT_41412 [Delitschia confertaspora ATCC 74209]
MEVQTTHFINGEWTTRTASLQEILAYQQQQQATPKQVSGFKNQFEIPQLGVLSRTVLPSPVIKFILPARIRHRRENDVVFVGEDCVQIKSIREYGHLHHVATKSDFAGHIIAARVFGESREEEAEFVTIKQEDGHAKATLPPQVLLLTLSTGVLMFLWADSGETGTIQFHQRTIPLPRAHSSLTIQGRHLAVDPYRRAIAVAGYEGFILYRTKSMSEWREEICSGQNTTPIVDERGFRFEGSIMRMEFLFPTPGPDGDNHVILLFAISHRNKTKLSCYDWDNRNGLRSANARAERVVVAHEDQNPVLLIPLKRGPDFLLVSRRGEISDYRNILSGIPTKHRVTLDHEENLVHPGNSKRKPVFVQWARMRRNKGFSKEVFYIAREDGIVIYVQVSTNAHTSNAGYFNCSLGTAFASLDVFHEPDKEHPAFEQLAAAEALSNADVLIGMGPDSDGQLNKVGDWMTDWKSGKQFGSFDFIESIPNWAPASDAIVSQLSGLNTGHERQRGAILVASGREPYGSISELRRGLNALVHRFVDLPHLTGGVTGTWILDYGTDEDGSSVRVYVILLVCLPPRSFVFRLSGSPGGDFDDIEELDGSAGSEDGIERSHETLVACSSGEGVSIQVTREAILLLVRSDESLSCVDKCSFPASSAVFAAAVRAGCPFVVAAFRQDSGVKLRSVPIQPTGEGKFSFGAHEDIPLPADVTCLELIAINGTWYLLMGTITSLILLFTIDEDGLLLVLKESLGELSTTSLLTVCESAALLDGPYGPVIVCGMRNGELWSFNIDDTPKSGSSDDDITIASKRFVRMGTTAAHVTRSQIDSTTAFVACGSDLCRIQCSRNDPAGLEIDSVWFTDRNMPGYQQSSVSALAQLPRMNDASRNLSGYLFSILGTKLLIAQFDFDVRWSANGGDVPSPRALGKVVPRKLHIGVTPTKLLYSASLRTMVVATKQAKEERGPPLGCRTIPWSLKFLMLDDETIENDSKLEDEDMLRNHLVAAEVKLQPYETVHCIQEWTYTLEKKKYAFIIIGTGIEGSQTGRQLFVKYRVSKTGERQATLVKEKIFPQPIYSMAFFGEHKLAFVSGKTLYLDEFSFEKRRWEKRGTTILRSFGIHITACAPFIYVSMSTNSHICLKVVPDPEPADANKVKFLTIFTDSVARELTSHLVIELPQTEKQLAESRAAESRKRSNSVISTSSQPASTQQKPTPSTLVIVADKRCSVAALLHPPIRTFQSSAPTVFEASLSRSITRLHRGNIRPPWRRPTPVNPSASNATSSRPSLYSSRSATEPMFSGVLVDDIIGTSTDGSVFSLSILEPPAFKLLKVIENLIRMKKERRESHHIPTYSDDEDEYSSSEEEEEEDKKTGDYMEDVEFDTSAENPVPLITSRDVEPRVEDWGPGKARLWSVDGDLVMGWLEKNERLGILVGEGTKGEVVRLVVGFCREVLRDEGVEMEVEERVLGRAEEWVRGVMMPLL